MTRSPIQDAMRFIITLITTAAFVLHFALGCCAHHAHADDAAGSSSLAEVAALGHACHGDHVSEHIPSDSPSDCPDQGCDDGHCVFMVAGKAVVEKANFPPALPLCIAEPAFLSASSSRVTASIRRGLVPLPVRTHLFNQVLLI